MTTITTPPINSVWIDDEGHTNTIAALSVIHGKPNVTYTITRSDSDLQDVGNTDVDFFLYTRTPASETKDQP
jgi:hypothetical protein